MNYMEIYENYGRIDLFRDNQHTHTHTENNSSEWRERERE